MRLIDADKLIEDIEKLNQELLKDLEYADAEALKVTNKAQLYIICESVIPKIKEQPTAFDVDKVVEQLESLEPFHIDGYGDVMVNCDDVIDIVKAGGLDE